MPDRIAAKSQVDPKAAVNRECYNSSMMQAEGKCWLCGKWAKLTREHIPPRSAFNDSPLLLHEVETRSADVGYLEWSRRRESGLIAVSLCGDCNSSCGGKYGSHYAEFIRKIAEPVEKARDGDVIFVPGISRPLSILKAVTQSFVSSNGPAFVEANPWVRKFLRNSRDCGWPRDIFLYVFATNSRGGRKSGVSGFYEFARRKSHVIAEFTFWPLGTVMSFGEELADLRLAPIHHWTSYDYAYRGTVDLKLAVNPVATAHPLDFRTKAEVDRGARRVEEQEPASRSVLDDLCRQVAERSGETDKDTWRWIARQVPRISE